MVDRFLAWAGASVVTAGVTVAMLAGAGLAVAQDGSALGGAGGTESTPSSSSESKHDSKQDAPGGRALSPNSPGSKVDDNAVDGANGQFAAKAPETASDQETIGRRHFPRSLGAQPFATATNPDVDTGQAEDISGTRADLSAEATDDDATSDSGDAGADGTAARMSLSAQSRETNDEQTELEDKAVAGHVENAENDTDEADSGPIAFGVQTLSVAVENAVEEITATPAVAAVAFASAPSPVSIGATAAAPQFSGLLSAIGTIVFNLYALATRVVGGPPVLPPNSTVTVRSSTLRIDCGNGYEVPADWYIPAGAELNPPDRLIYLQHGFLASGPWYSHTAAALAEQTNSIVVAPSITSNFLSCDACWLGAPPMHRAVANLFKDNNTALAESALAAGYSGPIPNRVVLVGHSLGGGLVAGTAGYMVDNHTVDRLAGVVMLDGVGLDGSMVASLTKVPEAVPIYQLAAPTYFWNQDGVGSVALLQARPFQFAGVTLVGGSHVDAMRGGNFLIQFSQQLVSGFSSPQNVAAAQILMVGWVNDMFAGNMDDGIYANPSEEITIDTPAGPATAIALPNALTKPFPLNFLMGLVPLGDGLFTFEPTCLAEPVGVCNGSIAA